MTTMSTPPEVDLSLYLVVDRPQLERAGHDPVTAVRDAVAGGVTAVQVRDKQLPTRDTLAFCAALAETLPPSVAIIVDDRVDVVLAARETGVHLAGVHVGQSDLPAHLVRRLLGPGAVIGVSAQTAAMAREAEAAGADHLGIGAVHGTTTKADAPAVIGVEGVAAVAAATALPAVAIGGISAADLPALRRAGLDGAAVVSAICSSPSPFDAAAELRRAWEDAR